MSRAASLLLLLLSLPASAQEGGSDTTAALEQAYQKEYAYLAAEKRALQGRSQDLRADASARIRQGEAALGDMEARLLALEKQANEIGQRITSVEDATVDAEASRELIATTVSQAGEALGLEVEEGLLEAEQLSRVFDAALARLEAGGAVHVAPGAFFLPDGTQVRGQVVQVGEVAAYGVSERGSGSLLPLGEGRLQLRPAGGGEEAARALAAGQRPAVLGAFLFESLDKPITERAEQTWAEFMEGGGAVGWVIVGLGAIAMLLAAIRGAVLALAGRGLGVVEPVAAHIAREDLAAARQQVAGRRTPTARVLHAILTAAERTRDREALQDVASEAMLYELPALERFGAIIIVAAAVAPLLGLLGTVTGMIATFDVLTEVGAGDPKMLSGGISEALITTELGLVVAIPAVLLGNVLRGRADAVIAGIERSALRVVNLLADADEQDAPGVRLAGK